LWRSDDENEELAQTLSDTLNVISETKALSKPQQKSDPSAEAMKPTSSLDDGMNVRRM